MSPQAAVYNAVAKEIVGDVCRGFDGTVLCYGQASRKHLFVVQCGGVVTHRKVMHHMLLFRTQLPPSLPPSLGHCGGVAAIDGLGQDVHDVRSVRCHPTHRRVCDQR